MFSTPTASDALFDFLIQQNDAMHLFMGEPATKATVLFALNDGKPPEFTSYSLCYNDAYISHPFSARIQRTAHERLALHALWPEWYATLASLVENLLPPFTPMPRLAFELTARRTQDNAFQWSSNARRINTEAPTTLIYRRDLKTSDDLARCVHNIHAFLTKESPIS